MKEKLFSKGKISNFFTVKKYWTHKYSDPLSVLCWRSSHRQRVYSTGFFPTKKYEIWAFRELPTFLINGSRWNVQPTTPMSVYIVCQRINTCWDKKRIDLYGSYRLMPNYVNVTIIKKPLIMTPDIMTHCNDTLGWARYLSFINFSYFHRL